MPVLAFKGCRGLFLAVLFAASWARCQVAAPVTSQETAVPLFAPTLSNPIAAPAAAPEGMVQIPGGEFSMGSGDPTRCACGGTESMSDAQPVHRVYVDGFWMDATDVTNEQFATFVAATGYITVAERKPRAEDFPGAAPEDLVPGAVVFVPPAGPVPLDNPDQWWRYVKGANWRHPQGPATNLLAHEKDPVVQVAHEDAEAYAAWAGKRLPTEAEWEFAARGGLSGKLYAWGDEFRPSHRFMANTYQGHFPEKDTGEDGFSGISPVKSFPPNGYGLYDMSGDVWQWCSDWYRPDYFRQLAKIGGVARNPQGPAAALDPAESGVQKRVRKGGSQGGIEVAWTTLSRHGLR
jgi:sulfatase modifying factor 1